MNILVTGGAGYIGSHVVKLLIEKGYTPIIFDNLSRGHMEAVPVGASFANIDLLDKAVLEAGLKQYQIDAVIHFAAFAYVNESVLDPAMYYRNNVVGSFNLFSTLAELGILKAVFSSTCSIFGNPVSVPISEAQASNPINPYAKTKLMVEQILADFDDAYGLKSVCLRYFNAAGDSSDGSIGESHDPEPHLIPLILETALGKRDHIKIYGDDYNTPDGTCLRDYIHVEDLADAHVRALEYLLSGKESTIINLGTGTGNSVKEVIRVAREITGQEIPEVLSPRRAGDPAALVADNTKAKEVLGWEPKYDIHGILKTAWAWHSNPRY